MNDWKQYFPEHNGSNNLSMSLSDVNNKKMFNELFIDIYDEETNFLILTANQN